MYKLSYIPTPEKPYTPSATADKEVTSSFIYHLPSKSVPKNGKPQIIRSLSSITRLLHHYPIVSQWGLFNILAIFNNNLNMRGNGVVRHRRDRR